MTAPEPPPGTVVQGNDGRRWRHEFPNESCPWLVLGVRGCVQNVSSWEWLTERYGPLAIVEEP